LIFIYLILEINWFKVTFIYFKISVWIIEN